MNMANDSRRGLGSPNLLIVGFLKCGTTSLARHLSDHPDIASPIAKELYYLIDPTSKLVSMQPVIGKLSFGEPETNRKDARFIDFFPNTAGKKYAMDATPFYYSQRCALRYAEKNPDTKVIFMMRSPDRRVLSSFRFFQSMYQEYPDSSFSEFVDAILDNGERKAGYRKKIKKEFFRELFDDELEMGCYKDHISKWMNAIGGERVFLGTMEKLRDDPEDFMSMVCDFLGINRTFYHDYSFSPYMQSYQVRFPLLQKLGRKLGKEDPMRYDSISRFQSPFHRLSTPVLRRGLESVYRVFQHRPASLDDERDPLGRLTAYYSGANVALRDRYGIDYTAGGAGRSNSKTLHVGEAATVSGRA